MSDALKAAEEVRRFIGTLQALVQVEEVLRNFGSIQQSVGEAEAKRAAVQREVAEAEALLVVIDEKAAKVRSDAAADAADLRRQGEEALEQARLREANLTREALLERDRLVQAATDRLAQIQAETRDAEAKHAVATEQLAAVQASLNDFREQRDRLLATMKGV